MRHNFLVSAATAALLPCAAAAQTAPADNAPTEADVIVTAQKRAENIQRVPLAVSALTSDQLQIAGVETFDDLVKISPSFTVQEGDQPGNSTLYLRGIGTTGSSVGIEPSVATQIDDAPAGFRQRVFTDLLDVERVEVLRGPQSTLYGKSASAGLINIITKDPSKKFTARIEGLVTDDRQWRVSATASSPITSTLGFRLSASYNSYDGNVRNLANNTQVNSRREFSARGKLLWEPSERFSAQLILSYNRQNNDCCVPVLLQHPATLTAPATYIGRNVNVDPVLAGIPGKTIAVETPGIVPGPDNRSVYLDNPPYQDGDDFSQNLKLSYNFAHGIEIALIGLSSHYLLNDGVDADFTNDATIQVIQTGYTKANSRSLELRLTTPADKRIRFVAGAFAQWIDAERQLFRSARSVRVGTSNRTVAGAINYLADHFNRDRAFYMQTEFDVLPQTTLTGGVRFQTSRWYYRFNDFLNNRFYPVDTARNLSFPGAQSDDAVTGKIALQHQFTRDVMGYISYSTGYKAGAYDLTSSFNDAVARQGSVLPERSRSYEFGFRTQWFNRALTLNVTGFYGEYSNFQARQFNPDLGLTFFTNVPLVRTRGIEADGALRLGKIVRLTGSLAYTDAVSRDFRNADCYPLQTVAQGCVVVTGTTTAQNLSGQRLPNAPEWKFNIGYSVTQPVVREWTLVWTGSYTYQSSVNFLLTRDPLTFQPAYGILNTALALKNKKLSFGIFVNNLLNQDYATAIARSNYFYTDRANVATRYQGDGTQRIIARDVDRYIGGRISIAY